MKMSYAPTFHTQPKSDLITITDGEPQVDQKYYLIPFWIRDIFRDNGLHYKDMIESEIVSSGVNGLNKLFSGIINPEAAIIKFMVDMFVPCK